LILSNLPQVQLKKLSFKEKLNGNAQKQMLVKTELFFTFSFYFTFDSTLLETGAAA